MPAKKHSAHGLLGIGLYAAPEAARYARVSPQKFARWVFGPHPVFEPQLGREDRIATFLDFAQSLSVQEIRLTVLIPLQKIRAAYLVAQKEHGVEYPFAMKHGIFVFGDLNRPEACELGIFVPNGAPPPEAKERRDEFIRKKAVQITGKHKGNQLISEIVKSFSRNLVFRKPSGTADEYVAYEGHGHRILMDPDIRFGKPYLEGIGYEADTLAEAATIEGSVSRAAKLYHVDDSAIRAAVDFHKLLDTPPPKQPAKRIAA
jgi:uncharacterized protein (DUF433 family)